MTGASLHRRMAGTVAEPRVGEVDLRAGEHMDALLLGRKTYDIFSGYWPTAPPEIPFSRLLNDIPKYVASRTLTGPLAWQEASLVTGDLVDGVAALKAVHEEAPCHRQSGPVADAPRFRPRRPVEPVDLPLGAGQRQAGVRRRNRAHHPAAHDSPEENSNTDEYDRPATDRNAHTGRRGRRSGGGATRGRQGPGGISDRRRNMAMGEVDGAVVGGHVAGRGGCSLQRPCPLPGIGLSTAKLNRVIDYPADDMTVTVEAGITISELNKLLAEKRQWLPVDVAFPDRATVGGAIATNAAGPRRYAYGTMRDYLLGFTAVDGTGTIFSGGGRVVKNAAGYNMCRLMAGSRGTLGIITQATLMVRPLPEAAALLACEVPDFDLAEKLLASLVRSAGASGGHRTCRPGVRTRAIRCSGRCSTAASAGCASVSRARPSKSNGCWAGSARSGPRWE